MTKEEMQKILQIFDLDYEAEPTLVYVFFERPDGRVDNFSISVRRGGQMDNRQLEELMRREYPATRQGRVVAVDRPDYVPPVEWVEATDVCNMLRVSPRTLRRWTLRGLFHPSQIGRRVYFMRDEVESVLRNNAVLDNGRFDSTALHGGMGTDK